MPIGSKLMDRNQVKQTLGQGGMGVVYWACDTTIKRVPLLTGVALDSLIHNSSRRLGIGPLLGRMVQKTMAKQSWNRFGTARDLVEAMQRGLRNEPIASVNSAKILPPIVQFASDILTGLESEGHLVPKMAPLRRRIDLAVRQRVHSPCSKPHARGSKTRNIPTHCKKFMRHSGSTPRMPKLFTCSTKLNPIGVPDSG